MGIGGSRMCCLAAPPAKCVTRWISLSCCCERRKKEAAPRNEKGPQPGPLGGHRFGVGGKETRRCLFSGLGRQAGNRGRVRLSPGRPGAAGCGSRMAGRMLAMKHPVDRLTHRMFHREHAACHPANSTKCPRPPRIAGLLKKHVFRIGWDPTKGKKTVAEVYPHPAMVRMFGIPRIVKYKKGSVAERRKEFRRLQGLLKQCLKNKFPDLRVDSETATLLKERWSKPVEDRTDALFCALIGLWHWKHQGKRSEVIGDRKAGFILLPAEDEAGRR
ncbi:MAG: DUF429 domain-containing protein [Verrucomicrobia bacterium]|nr:DUF429 domain-containing protein [Verrucomicrobiota bacterium]